ncbi:hypothetical protein SGRI78S_01051 [Streptomyces griseus subsp. griseus]
MGPARRTRVVATSPSTAGQCRPSLTNGRPTTDRLTATTTPPERPLPPLTPDP